MSHRIFLGLILTAVSVGAVLDSVFRNVRNKFIWVNESLPEVSDRIHGGFDAAEGQFNFMVFLLILINGNFYQTLTCSASLITKQWVLTAAHCVDLPNSSVIAVAGKADLRLYIKERLTMSPDEDINENALRVQERRVFRIFVHPKYHKSNNSYDFAMLLLERPFVEGLNRHPKVLPLPISEDKMTSPKNCTVIGWGLNEEDKQTFRLMFASEIKAKNSMLCHYIKSGPFLCLEQGGPGICKGDSGGPLVCDNKIWGVASFALSEYEYPSCLLQEEEYYSEIYEVLPWISSTLKNSSGGLNNRAVMGVFYLGLSFLWFLR